MWRRQIADVRPGERAGLVDDRADGLAKGPPAAAVHRHLGHGVLPGERLAARLVIHVARQAGEVLGVEITLALRPRVAVGEDLQHRGGQRADDERRDREEEDRAELEPVPEKAQLPKHPATLAADLARRKEKMTARRPAFQPGAASGFFLTIDCFGILRLHIEEESVKAPSFAYAKARSLADAFDLQERPGARILAGGQSLIRSLNMRIAQPELLVDITALPLKDISAPKGALRIGAL